MNGEELTQSELELGEGVGFKNVWHWRACNLA